MAIHRRKKYRWAMASAMALVSPIAWADCFRDTLQAARPRDVFFDFGNVDASGTPGTGRLATTTVTLPPVVYHCTDNFRANLIVGRTDAIGAGWSPREYPTLIPGLVVRLFGPTQQQFNYLGGVYTCQGNASRCTLSGITVRAELWKVRSGSLAPGSIFPLGGRNWSDAAMFFGRTDGSSYGTASFLYEFYGRSGTITPGTCSLQTRSITKTLDDVSLNMMAGVGWAPERFDAMPPITLNCPNNNIRIGATLSDQTTPGNSTNVLTVQGGAGAATGVGLQVARAAAGPALVLRQPWTFNSVSPTTTVQLFARYYQTAERPTEGSVTGRATLTLTYN
ncbi:fimbrial protein [[Pseudomonas] boreopolis]|uniref:fimbrial protein n=1 Tax=Xanthomonas boreopolis TaxID=86183 RepID=UPI003DA0AB59